MLHLIILTTVTVFTISVTCLPSNLQASTDQLLPKIDIATTISTDLASANEIRPKLGLSESIASEASESTVDDVLITPLLPGTMDEEKNSAILLLININAVKNQSADNLNDVLDNDVIKEVPHETAVPSSLFLLVIKDDDETAPVSLDEVVEDLEKEGFDTVKIIKDGETRLVKVDLNSIKMNEPNSNENVNSKDMSEQRTEIQKFGQLASIRRKRDVCLKCTIVIKQKYPQIGHGSGYHHDGYRGGHGGGCGGGYGCSY